MAVAAAAARWLSDAMAMKGLINLARRHCHCLPLSIDVCAAEAAITALRKVLMIRSSLLDSIVIANFC